MNCYLILTLLISMSANLGCLGSYVVIDSSGSDLYSQRTGNSILRSRRDLVANLSSVNDTVAGMNNTAPNFVSVIVSTTSSTTRAPLVDQHTYYTTQLFDDFDRFWVELYFGKLAANTATNYSYSSLTAFSHDKLSVSYRTAAVVDLRFSFPFYGHPVKRVVIATGGFIYVGEVLNPRLLTFSQFIAPLMANFDFSLGDFSSKRLLYFANETVLIVEWRDVVLQEHQSLPFRFQAHIYRDGRIIFAYRDIPLNVNSISQNRHPVEISLSDAYSSERKDAVTGTSFQTMHVYSETRVPNDWVKSRSVVVMTPLPTCVQLTSCNTCLTPSSNLAFKCAWCPNLRRCSVGFDRGRKSWIENKCDLQNVTQSSECSSLPWSQRDGESLFSSPLSPTSGSSNASGVNASAAGAWAVLLILVVLIILAAIGLCIGWIVYAHKHPGSRAGIWLVEHRPARLLHNGSDFFRRKFVSARDFLSSNKSDADSSSNRQQPAVAYSCPHEQNSFDVSIGGVTVPASRI